MPSFARQATLSVLATASCMILAMPAAQATAPSPSGPSAPPGQPTPRDGGYTADASECLPDEEGDPPEYGPYDDVSSIDEFGSDNKYLYCGDDTKGVLHIAEAHPIDLRPDSNDDDYIRTCVQNFGSYGYDLPEDPDNNNYEMEMSLDKDGNGTPDDSARLAYSKGKNGDGIYPIVSVHTKQTEDYPQGNDWYGCAESPISTSAAHQHVKRR